MKKTIIIAQTLIFGGKEILNIIKITASIKNKQRKYYVENIDKICKMRKDCYEKKTFIQLVKSGAATRV